MKYFYWLLASFSIPFVHPNQAQSVLGPGIIIPDNGTPVASVINVNQLNGNNIDTVGFGLESVCINITHTYTADLRLELIAPDGTKILLAEGVGGSGDNFTNTCFRQSTANSIVNANPPFTGVFRPMGQLGRVNNGQSGIGAWKLIVTDTYASDTGLLLNWSLLFGTQPATYTGITSSNLPLFLFDTEGQTIVDEPKVKVRLKVVHNANGQRNFVNSTQFHYNGYAGIEFRGSSSQQFPKKPYGFETWDSAGAEVDFPLLGFPAEADWTLIANYSDKSLIRNALLYQTTRATGRYAARNALVEVLVNGEYMGVYLMTEKLKRDNNRINLPRLNVTDTSGTRLTGGYILKVDKATGTGGNDGFNSIYPPWHGNANQSIRFLYEYPAFDEINNAQKAYIKSVVDSFEATLRGSNWLDPQWGYRRFVEAGSFVDFYLLNELSRNVDGYRISTYFHKNRDNAGFSPLVMGPVWDFDIAFGNANYCMGDQTTGWAWMFNQVCPADGYQVPFWWERFTGDPAFNNEARCRWNALRQGPISNVNMMARIDSLAGLLQESQQRNFTQWPILGIYTWPNVAPFPTTYAGEIQKLKQWIQVRMNWMDQNLPGICSTVGTTTPTDRTSLQLWPNPAQAFVRAEGHGQWLKLTDVAGRHFHLQAEAEDLFAVSNLQPGLYVISEGPQQGKRLLIFR